MEELQMNPNSIQLPQDKPTDNPQGMSPQIDEEDVKHCVMEDFTNDVKDKENFGWLEKQEYAVRAYYGIKDAVMMNRPWPGASAYPVPITPTLLDTGHANIKGSMRSDDGNWCSVAGVGQEDIRKAVPLASLLNWQLGNQISMDRVQDLNIFRTLLTGNGIIKVLQDIEKMQVRLVSIDVENIYLPIDAEGMQHDFNNGHVTQIIPLSKNDLDNRKAWGLYKDLDKLTPGARISSGQSVGSDTRQRLMDDVTGLDKEQRLRRETYYLAETYKEYFPKSGTGYGSNGSPSRAGVRPIKIIVWWSPNGGTIHRIAKNDGGVVPFANHDLYPHTGYFFSMSLPEKIRNIQEKANYADKQNTDAMDKAIMPAMFVSDTSELEKSRVKRVPGGIYNLGRDQNVQYEPMPPRERGFETEIQRMWLEAQQLTGLIDISYGSQAKDQTLGQTQIRSFRADIRFADIFDRYERGFKETLDLIYHYDNKYMDRKTKVKVLGYADYKSIDEIFPNQNSSGLGLGIEGKFDFTFAGAAISEREKAKQDTIAFYGAMLSAPDVMANPHDNWKVKEKLAEAYGIRDLETVITKPAEAMILSAQDAVQRVVSGQTGIQLRPGIDTDSYISEIELFMHSETFLALEQNLQAEIFNMLKTAYIMRAGELRAMMDDQIVQQRQQSQNQMMMEEEDGRDESRTESVA